MNYGALFFLAGFLALSSSWLGMVLVPQLQVGRQELATNSVNGALYPSRRPGLAEQGAQVYRANGCVSCHSQQVHQDGTVFDVVLNEIGTNRPAVVTALKAISSEPDAALAALPYDVVRGVDKPTAEAAANAFKDTGAKIETHVRPVGADIERGWGHRGNVGQDYLQDNPVFLGSQRLGPDLANVGLRPWWDATRHLNHLYAPASIVQGSTMPAYRFLFKKQKIGRQASPDALNLTGALAPEAGFEIVPTERARALVAYLQSLQSDVPLFEAPLTVAAAPADTATNAPAK